MRVRILQASVLFLLIVANFFKWLVFGRLTSNEIERLRKKAGYTIWEFVFGFLVFYNSTANRGDVCNDAWKYAGLFLCVFLVKCFHYLTADRVHTVQAANDAAGGIAGRYLHLRLGLGIFCLNVVDTLLIYKYWSDITNYGSRHNVLVAIFGFEIMTHFPMTLGTTLQFALNTYEAHLTGSSQNWKLQKVRTIFAAEFVLNLARLAMSWIFSILFLYHYTFPVHMLPAAYTSLKMAVLRTRMYIDLRKRDFRLGKLQIAPPGGTCIVCYDDIGTDARAVPSCGHTFHYECILQWMDYLSSCPVCRERI